VSQCSKFGWSRSGEIRSGYFIIAKPLPSVSVADNISVIESKPPVSAGISKK
jgi:hypothetical protein